MALFQEDEPGHDLKWLFGAPMTVDVPRNTSIVIDDDHDHDEYDQGSDATSSSDHDDSEYPDFFDMMRAPIGSERLKFALERAGVDNVEFFPTTIEEPSGKRLAGYYAMNIVGRISCVDSERSVFSKTSTQKIVRIDSLVLREENIGGAKLFRLHEYPEIIVITEDVASAVRSLPGVLLSPATGWSDAHRF